MPTSSPWHATKHKPMDWRLHDVANCPNSTQGAPPLWGALACRPPRSRPVSRTPIVHSCGDSPDIPRACLHWDHFLHFLPHNYMYSIYIMYVFINIYIYYQSICSLSWTCWSVKREWKSIGSLCWCVTISGGFLRWTVSSWLFVVIPRNLPFTDPWRVLASAWLCPVEGTWCILPVEWSRNKKLLGAKGIATRSKDATRGSWPYY